MTDPSQQNIQDHLNGLNRVSRGWAPTSESEAAKQKGIDNYRRWFKAHEIAISQDTKGVWKLDRL